jgi:hypothetical protein
LSSPTRVPGEHAMTGPCRLRDHLPVPLADPKGWLAWRLLDLSSALRRLAARLEDGISEDPEASAIALYLDMQALKAPEAITPGPRVARHMTTRGTPTV